MSHASPANRPGRAATPEPEPPVMPRGVLPGLILPGFVFLLVVGAITLLKPDIALGAFVTPRVWLLVVAAFGVGTLLALSLRLLRGPRWLAFTGFWLPILAAMATAVIPTYVVVTVSEPAPEGLAPVHSAPPAGRPVEIDSGPLTGVRHRADGQARLIRLSSGDLLLRLDGLAIEPGPDYHVYLLPGGSRTKPGDNAIELGALRANRGALNYPVGGEITVDNLKTVLIWCRVFEYPVATATLR